MEWVWTLPALVWRSFARVVSYPLNPAERLHVLYLLTSLLCAIGVFLLSGRRGHDDTKRLGALDRLVQFVFPRDVWQHRSTWVDIRYFIPHQMVRVWIYTSLATVIGTTVARSTHISLAALKTTPGAIFAVEPGFWTTVAYTVASIVAIDFLAFITHYCQHTVPILWQFHKVHHSAEVLNPLSNYREHPIDNVTYAATLALGTGTTAGVFQWLFGVAPSLINILGINAAGFLFNISGYHLRHSHIWLRWPDPLAHLFGCPAHHQIHHSCKPEHVNKNMAFIFPIWDVLFGTFYLPKQREELVFGIGDGTEAEYKGLLSIYVRPFAELFTARRPEEGLVRESSGPERPSGGYAPDQVRTTEPPPTLKG